MVDDPEDTAARSRQSAWILGLISLLPFIVLAAALLLGGRQSGWFHFLTDAFKTWSAITLSVLGGIRFGIGLRREPPASTLLGFAVLPALLGWLALFAPDRIGLAVLLVGHCAQGAWDSISSSRGGAPRWYGEMRIVTTLVAAAAHIAAFVALF
jgi:hypothetical protein